MKDIESCWDYIKSAKTDVKKELVKRLEQAIESEIQRERLYEDPRWRKKRLEILKRDMNANEGVYISKSLAKELFDTESAVGKSIKMHDTDNSFNVLGVYEDVQSFIYNEAGEFMVIVKKYDEPSNIRHVAENVIHINAEVH